MDAKSVVRIDVSDVMMGGCQEPAEDAIDHFTTTNFIIIFYLSY